MPSNKPRLYVAIYRNGARNNEQREYHWGFLIGPKLENTQRIPALKIHVRRSAWGWNLEEHRLWDVRATPTLLARILIAKIEDMNRLIGVLDRVGIVPGDPSWTSRHWVAGAVADIARDGRCVGTAELDWLRIQARGRQYVRAKFQTGRYGDELPLFELKPTWDMLKNMETVP
ncbi:hypothetical protein F5Y09DRAFT_340911 [Xylaria sp. FL1042]|nr:hypothetical protein F5Y09DRAFT_340911 [Xylaria sp. FL1042]